MEASGCDVYGISIGNVPALALLLGILTLTLTLTRSPI